MHPCFLDMDPTNNTKSFFLKSCSANTDHHFHLHHHQPPPEMVASYKECLKNHAATIGGHAVDGCGEFMPTPTATPTDPTSLRCAACGCHRNFHRRDPYEGPAYIHHLPLPLPPPPLPLNPSSSPSQSESPGPSSSPTQTPSSPVPYSYYSSAPHMLLALSTAYSGRSDETHHHHHHHHHSNSTKTENGVSGRKRSRTKFSQEQKEKMHEFAEKLGWRMPRNEEKLVEEFCGQIGIRRGVLKVWMHNHKQNLGKREMGTANSNSSPDD